MCIYLYIDEYCRVVVPQVMKHVGCISSFHLVACLNCWHAVIHDDTLVIFL